MASFTSNLKNIAQEAKVTLNEASLEKMSDDVLPIDIASPASVVTAQIIEKLQTRDTNLPGIVAFFTRLGEQARTKLANAQADNARAILELDKVRQAAIANEFASAQQGRDLIRNKIIELAQARAKFSLVLKEIEFIEHERQLTLEAASRGFDFVTDQRIREKQTEINAELGKMKSEIDHKLHEIEETERIKYEYEEKKITAEVEATIRLADTDNLNRAQMLIFLEDYIQKMETTTSPRMKRNYKKEVLHLERKLHDKSRMVSEEDAGDYA